MTRVPSATARRRLLVMCAIAGAAGSAAADVGAQAPDSAARRPLATRTALQSAATALAGRDRPTAETRALESLVKRRLTDGDFRPGDLILLEVQGEPTLSDTFSVGPGRELRLPSPAVGTLPLYGVLRSEAAAHVGTFIGRFIHQPVVRVRPLIRLAFEGEVGRAGFHAVPADAPLSDAFMAAHGITAHGDLDKVRIARAGKTVLQGRALRNALARGWTVDDAGLRDGDALVVGGGRVGVEGRLRFLWVVVSLVGGIYGLTRAL